jgi:hypothetical protein
MTLPLLLTYTTTPTQHPGKYLFSSTDVYSPVQETGTFRDVVLMCCCVFVTGSPREINIKMYMIHNIVLCKEDHVETKYT